MRIAVLVAAGIGVASCQRLVGIHAPRDAGASSDRAAADLDGGAGDARPDLGAEGRGGGDGSAAGDVRGIDTGAIDVREAGGGTADASDAGDAGDAGNAGPDANHCAVPWHAENAQAGVYTIAGSGTTACGFAAATLPTLTAALDTTDFRGALACGSCLRVQPTFGSASVVVRVVDLSGASGLLLNRAAIDQIATPGSSSLNVDWQLVPCDTQNQTLGYLVKDGSNSNFVGIQVRRQRYPVASVVAVGNRGQTLPLTLQVYNYWESTAAGVGATPLTLRLTDINGQIVEDSGIAVTPLSETTGLGQFPLCQ